MFKKEPTKGFPHMRRKILKGPPHSQGTERSAMLYAVFLPGTASSDNCWL